MEISFNNYYNCSYLLQLFIFTFKVLSVGEVIMATNEIWILFQFFLIQFQPLYSLTGKYFCEDINLSSPSSYGLNSQTSFWKRTHCDSPIIVSSDGYKLHPAYKDWKIEGFGKRGNHLLIVVVPWSILTLGWGLEPVRVSVMDKRNENSIKV